ncbi:MAG TPA: hypothetical protein VN976_04650 [Verrucomicrobiae bacterium]|nr:hypothetical protein [Verrucomicrobiae bacterium]
MSKAITRSITRLLRIVDDLQKAHPSKKFTLDGRLVGDIGEILVEEYYDVSLFEDMRSHHDGESKDGRKVQIKATMKENLTFPGDHIPDYYLGIKINKNGSFVEVFNGPGAVAAKAVEGRKRPKTNLHSISIKTLAVLSRGVNAEERIPNRTTHGNSL